MPKQKYLQKLDHYPAIYGCSFRTIQRYSQLRYPLDDEQATRLLIESQKYQPTSPAPADDQPASGNGPVVAPTAQDGTSKGCPTRSSGYRPQRQRRTRPTCSPWVCTNRNNHLGDVMKYLEGLKYRLPLLRQKREAEANETPEPAKREYTLQTHQQRSYRSDCD